jgi:signal transduction histidine kinase
VSPIASFTVVAVQLQLRSRLATAATLAICLAFVAGAAASPGLTVRDGLIAGGAWMVVEAVLARLLWRLLVRGGRDADQLLRARFAAERTAATAAARRADQRSHWATVHDTSASTLLMIGLGEVTGTEPWLSGQLRRDIALLDGPHDVDAVDVDVSAALRAVAERPRLRVEVDCPDGVAAPAPVLAALTGAAAEALENVRRHAGTGVATLVVRESNGRVEVVVSDRGRGFDPAGVGPQRLGLAWSVHDRMDAVGGRATVESAPGRGTVVRLRWPA